MGDRPTLPDWPGAMREDRAAAYLDVSVTWFREHVAPKVKARRPTKAVVLYRRVDLDRWLDADEDGVQASGSTNPWHQ